MIFMTPQIFLDTLCHGFLPVDRVELIVFDEVHHGGPNKLGKDTRHPYREIMTQLRKSGQLKCKILGLTASIINSSTSMNLLEDKKNKLSNTFESEVVFVEHVEVFKTKPKVKLWTFNESSNDHIVHKFFNKIATDLKRASRNTVRNISKISSEGTYVDSEEIQLFKKLSRYFTYAHEIYTNFGAWCLSFLCQYLSQRLTTIIEHASYSMYAKHLCLLAKILDDVDAYIRETISSPLSFVSNKALRFLELLSNFRDSDFSCLLFPTRRIDC